MSRSWVHKIDILNLVLSLVASGVAYNFWGFFTAQSVIAGALLMTLNFWALRLISAQIFQSDEPRKMIRGAILFAFKLIGLFILAYVCIEKLPIDPTVFGIAAAGMVMWTSLMSTLNIKSYNSMENT